MADKEYIEREAVIKQFDERYISAIQQRNLQESEEGEILWRGIQGGTNWGRNTIIDAPAADVVEVRHGEWVSVEGDVIFACSNCDAEVSTSWDYENDGMFSFCPCCGAKMDGERKE